MVQGLLAESSTQKGAFRDIYFGADYRISDNFYNNGYVKNFLNGDKRPEAAVI
jgi:hypothetical protein